MVVCCGLLLVYCLLYVDRRALFGVCSLSFV